MTTEKPMATNTDLEVAIARVEERLTNLQCSVQEMRSEVNAMKGTVWKIALVVATISGAGGYGIDKLMGG